MKLGINLENSSLRVLDRTYRTVQVGEKKWFQQKDTKKNIIRFIILSVIKFIHFVIPTVEKKNTKTKYKLKSCEK
jgi:hypothetical protein